MGLAYESNTDLAFNTADLRDKAGKYGEIANELRTMAKDLDDCLTELKNNGWTTPAGSAFQKMADTNWKQNIERYAAMLDTLKEILSDAAGQYEALVTDHIEQTKL